MNFCIPLSYTLIFERSAQILCARMRAGRFVLGLYIMLQINLQKLVVLYFFMVDLYDVILLTYRHRRVVCRSIRRQTINQPEFSVWFTVT